jgi:hypothetical protein
MQAVAVRSRWRAGMKLVLFAMAVGIVLVGVFLAVALFLFLLAPLALLVVGFYFYWRKEEHKQLFCPTCGRRYADEEGPTCPLDHTQLNHLV